MSRRFETASSPHLTPKTSVSKVMAEVLLALLPGIAAYCYLFGWGVISNIVVLVSSAWLLEAFMLKLRHKPIKPFLFDLSATVTAVLLAVALPAGSPWWLLLIGSLSAIVLAKHLYGGLGYNPFNPAMLGYVVLLICFPKEMTQWQAPLNDSLSACSSVAASLQQLAGQACQLDGWTAATVLDHSRSLLSQGLSLEGWQPSGWLASAGYEWVAAGWLIGGLWLWWRGIIHWQIPLSLLFTLGLCATLGWWLSPESLLPPLAHIFGGATLLGAFFIATDPVSASTTVKGRVFYGVLIGLLVYVIRSWGGYPDTIAFAVLLANLAAPTIDYYSKPKVFGYR